MANTKKVAPTLKQAQTKKLKGLTTTASKIRYLDSEGYAKADIARSLGIIYQHVRNTLITPITKAKA